jgi:hypothetical protein
MYRALTCAWGGSTWYLEVKEELVKLVIRNLRLCWPGCSVYQSPQEIPALD